MPSGLSLCDNLVVMASTGHHLGDYIIQKNWNEGQYNKFYFYIVDYQRYSNYFSWEQAPTKTFWKASNVAIFGNCLC